jgi:uncharacterized protein YxeA
MNKILLAVLLVVIVIAIGVFFFGNDDMDTELPSITVPSQSTTTDTATDTTSTNTGTNTPTSGNDVTPTNQLVLAENETSNSATIAYAQLTQPGYVALFRMNSQSDVSFVGSTDLLEAGEYTNVRVQLSSIAVEGQNLAAVLYADNGDGEFTYTDGGDTYLTNGTTFVSDVDVIGVDPEDEAEELSDHIDTYLEANN